MRRSLVVVVLAFAAGLALGWLARSTAQAPMPAPVPARPAAAPDTIGAARPGPASPPSLAEVLAAVPVPEIPPAGGVIRGRVLTTRGEPLAGARVTATPELSDFEPVESESPVEEALAYLALQKLRESGRVEAWSGSDGSFRLLDLADTRYDVQGRHENYWLEARAGGLRGNGDTADFVAHPRGYMDVTVRMPDGREAARAELRVSDKGRGEEHFFRTWTPARRRQPVAPGHWTVLARAGEADELRSEEIEVDVPADGPTPAVVLTLRELPHLVVRLRCEGGEAPQGYEALVAAVPDGAEPDPVLLRDARPGPYRNRGFDVRIFAGLPNGTYVVGAREPGGRLSAVHAVVTLAEGREEVELVIPPPPRESYLLAFVEGPAGPIVQEVTLSAMLGTGVKSVSSPYHAVRLPDGSFRIPFPEASGEESLPERGYLYVHSSVYGSTTAPFRRTEATTVRVSFDDPAWLDVDLEGAADLAAARELLVTVSAGAGGGGAGASRRANGMYTAREQARNPRRGSSGPR